MSLLSMSRLLDNDLDPLPAYIRTRIMRILEQPYITTDASIAKYKIALWEGLSLRLYYRHIISTCNFYSVTEFIKHLATTKKFGLWDLYYFLNGNFWNKSAEGENVDARQFRRYLADMFKMPEPS
jgi:hypothetical protein